MEMFDKGDYSELDRDAPKSRIASFNIGGAVPCGLRISLTELVALKWFNLLLNYSSNTDCQPCPVVRL